MDKTEVLRVLKEAKELGLEWTNFSGGELLLYKKWILDVFDWLKENDVEPSLVTNAMFITDEVAERLRRSETHVYVSLDGDKETHELMRGPGTWDRVIEGLDKLREHNVSFSTIMAISKLNYDRVEFFVRTSKELGAKSVAVIPVMPFGNALKSKIWVTSLEFVDALRRFESAVEQSEINGSVWCVPWSKHVLKSKRIHAGNCRKGSGMDIGPDGSVLLCDVLDVRLGSVRGRKVKEVWEEYLSNPLVRAVSNPSGDLCGSCIYFNSCMGGCYARALALRRSLEGDPLCPFLRKLNKGSYTLSKME